MTKLTNELDQRLRAFIHAPENFLDQVGLVNAFHHEPVLASQNFYELSLDGKVVVPVFTDETDALAFQAARAEAKEKNWVLRPVLDVLKEAIEKGASGLVFNLKQNGDSGNSTFFPSYEMIQFVNQMTLLLNQLMGDKNKAASLKEKYYLIPAFVLPKEEGEDRLFPTMANPDGDSYIPVFSNLTSFSKWYHHEQFGKPFRESKGQVLCWNLKELMTPSFGENELDQAVGVVVDPFDDDMTLLAYEELR